MSAGKKLPGNKQKHWRDSDAGDRARAGAASRIFVYVSEVTALFAIYFVAGKLALKLAFVNASATAFWPPTGIALAAFIVLGYRIWPGILLGAFLVNLTTAGSIGTSIGIAVGNTLEGLIGAYFVNRLANGRRVFDRPQDVFKFAVLAGLVCTTVSATVGVASLALGGFASWSQYRPVWLTWWLGDATGALTVAPPLILWSLNPRLRWNPARYFEAVVLLLSLCALGLIAFGDLFGLGTKNYPLEFICIPVVVWAAFRFGRREAATISLLLAGIAVWGTLRGFGPFVLQSANDSLLLLQSFMGLIAVMALSLAAVISEQKQAEQALGTNEEQLRLFVEHSPAAIAMFDRDMKYLIASHRWLSDHGVEDVVGRSHYEIFPDISERWKEIHRRCLAGAIEKCEEDRFPRADGAVDWVRWETHPWRNTQGEIGGIIIFSEVITDRKQAKDALQESEESYRVVAETANDCIIKISDESEILFANPVVQDIFGYTPAELLGRPLTMLMPEYLRYVHRASLKRYVDSGTRHINWKGVELPGLHKSGAEIPLEISFGEFVKDGKHVFTGVVRDITSRKEVERRLSAQHAITRILAEFSSLPDIAPRVLQALGENLGWSVGAIWTVDGNDKVLRCVGTWHSGAHATTEFEARSRELTFKIGVGLPGRVWQAKTAAWIPDVTRDSNFPRAPFAVKAGLHAAFGFPILLGNEVLAVIEFFSPEIHEPDSDLLQMLDMIGGQIGQFLERKRLEEQIRQAQKLESIGVLAGGVAHDFNNLLFGVLGNASLTLNTLSPTHPSRPFLEDVVRAAESAAHLTRQLLAYAGKGRFLIQPVNLSDVASELKSLIQTSIPRSVHLRLELAKDLPSVEGDPSQLQQLIMNLVINGAEAIPEGKTGSVSVVTGIQDVDEAYIRNTLAPAEICPGKYVFLEVQDTGGGMDQDTLAKIFDPFFTTKFSGRGLGLAAVLGIVRGHKGAIKVYSTPGTGTTFKALFPATEAAAGKRPGVAARDLRGTETVLVADDEEMVRRIAGEMLKQQGYSVILAANGLEAVETFSEQASEISIILLDLTMPLMSGEETLRRLQSIRRDVKVVLTSGYNEAEAIQRFAGNGLAGFIQKPYTAMQLAEKIKTVLEAQSQA